MTEKIVKDDVEFVHNATDLLDSEAQEAVKIIFALQMKYQGRPNTVENLDALRDEALTKLADIGILATVDPTPCFYGEPPVVEILGKVGKIVTEMDHEKKGWEVRKATRRGEEYLGQKERPNSLKPRK